ncbi:uncharacterized protein MELLADRAFT_34607, partial [Melampsora larici-populina 98AG31]
IKVQGWVKSIRNQKSISFLELVDGSCSNHLQIILNPHQSHGIQTGSSLKVIGKLVKSKGIQQGKELKCDEIEVVGKCSADLYPLQKKDHSLGFLRQHLHLRTRTGLMSSVLRLRSRMSDQASSYLNSLDFFKTDPPMISFNDCEGAGEVFRIQTDQPSTQVSKNVDDLEFFNQPAYLSVSSQLYLEAFAHGLGRVYTLGPCFRAESSQTNRHLAEFWMLEVEVSFCEELEEMMRLVERLIKFIGLEVSDELESVWKSQGLEKKKSDKIKEELQTRCPRISYKEEEDVVGNRLSKVEWGDSLGSEHEKWLAGVYFKSPVFITDYPKRIKPFYMLKNSDQQTVACFDLIVPGIGELVGGSLREFNEERLRENVEEKGMDGMDGKLDWYFDLRRFGTNPHAGFGIGWDRLVCWISGIENVREVIGFPRTIGMKNV